MLITSVSVTVARMPVTIIFTSASNQTGGCDFVCGFKAYERNISKTVFKSVFIYITEKSKSDHVKGFPRLPGAYESILPALCNAYMLHTSSCNKRPGNLCLHNGRVLFIPPSLADVPFKADRRG